MGTIVDKLQAVLDSKEAIKEKFNLPDNLPFSKYAENIKVEGGGSTVNTIEFYKCAEVGPAESGDTEDGGDTGSSTSSTDIIVSGFTDSNFNGTYTLEDSTAEGRERVWVKGNVRIYGGDNDYDWYIVTDEWDNSDNPPYAYGLVSELDIDTKENAPWNVSEWSLFTDHHGGTGTPVVTLASGGSDSGSTIELPEPVFAEKFNGALSNNFTQLGTAPEYSTIAGRQGLKCDYTHRLSTSCDGFPSGNAPRTMSAWVYCNPETLNGDFGFFVGYGGDADNCYYISTYYNHVLNYSEQMRPNYPEYLSWGELMADTWYHVVMAFDGNVMRCYLNGQEIGNFNISYNTNVIDYSLLIGSLTVNTEAAYDTSGYISDLQIYDVALTAEQVKELYGGIEDTPPLPANTWNGYKAVLVNTDDGTAYYEFSETLTEGLTYGKAFVPVVDMVYDAEAMIMATLFVKEIPILSTPDNLTGYENNEWKVNATNEFSSFVAWNAFDGNPDSIWADNGSSYLTWQNKLRQVLVKQLEFIYDGNAHSNYVRDIILEGSDNGSEWSTIGATSLTYTADGNYEKATVTFPSNETSYFYHRIYAIGQGRNLIGSLIGKRVIE